MYSRTLLSLVALGMLVTVGCSNQGPGGAASTSAKPAGGVGVVDLDAVAKALGRDLEMQTEAEQKLSQLNEELSSLQGAMTKQFADKREELGEELTDEQKRQLLQAKGKLELQFRDKKLNAERKLATYRQKLVEQFREETKPILRDVAAERGLSIVIPKNDALLLTVAAEVDLTDAVVLQMQKLQVAKADAPGAAPAKPKKKGAAAETSAR